MPHFVLDNAR